MFDIGFWELFLVGVVALIVLGPEQLPRTARTVGLLIGKARREVSRIREEIEEELDTEELKRIGVKKSTVTQSSKEALATLPSQSATAEETQLNSDSKD